MNGRRRRGAVVASCGLLVGSLIAFSACTSTSDDDAAEVGTADAYNAAIRWFLADLPPVTDTTHTGALVIFVAPASGKPIDVQAQADVAKEMADMKDVAVVRFADARDDAVQIDVEGEPVKDDGVLLLVGAVVQGRPPVSVEVEVYRNADDDHTYRMQITKASATSPTHDEFDATSVSEVAPG